MNITVSNNRKDFVNGQYNWRFDMRFRLNGNGEIDSYYDEFLQDVEFWLNSRTRDKWERRKNVIYLNHSTDMLMFSMNFSEHIRRVLENSAWRKSIETSTDVDDEEEPVKAKSSNVTEVPMVEDVMEEIKSSLEDDDDF